MAQRDHRLQPGVCRLGYPREQAEKIFHRQTPLRLLDGSTAGATALRLKDQLFSFPRVAETATLGLEAAAPFGLSERLSRSAF